MRIKDILGLGTEEQTARNGVLSSFGEWHSITIGSTVGMIAGSSGGEAGLSLMLLLAGLAVGTRKLEIGQLQDVRKEPAYALGSSCITFLLAALVIAPLVPQ